MCVQIHTCKCMTARQCMMCIAVWSAVRACMDISMGVVLTKSCGQDIKTYIDCDTGPYFLAFGSGLLAGVFLLLVTIFKGNLSFLVSFVAVSMTYSIAHMILLLCLAMNKGPIMLLGLSVVTFQMYLSVILASYYLELTIDPNERSTSSTTTTSAESLVTLPPGYTLHRINPSDTNNNRSNSVPVLIWPDPPPSYQDAIKMVAVSSTRTARAPFKCSGRMDVLVEEGSDSEPPPYKELDTAGGETGVGLCELGVVGDAVPHSHAVSVVIVEDDRVPRQTVGNESI